MLLLPPMWNASPSQGYPQYQLIHLGRERQCGVKFFVSRMERDGCISRMSMSFWTGVTKNGKEAKYLF